MKKTACRGQCSNSFISFRCSSNEVPAEFRLLFVERLKRRMVSTWGGSWDSCWQSRVCAWSGFFQPLRKKLYSTGIVCPSRQGKEGLEQQFEHVFCFTGWCRLLWKIMKLIITRSVVARSKARDFTRHVDLPKVRWYTNEDNWGKMRNVVTASSFIKGVHKEHRQPEKKHLTELHSL